MKKLLQEKTTNAALGVCDTISTVLLVVLVSVAETVTGTARGLVYLITMVARELPQRVIRTTTAAASGSIASSSKRSLNDAKHRTPAVPTTTRQFVEDNNNNNKNNNCAVVVPSKSHKKSFVSAPYVKGNNDRKEHQSVLQVPPSKTTTTTTLPRRCRDGEVAVYNNRSGQCVYSDGSPAHVCPGESVTTIPADYLSWHKGDRNKAAAAWEATQQWRRENDTWQIHAVPNRAFDDVKAVYPLYIHGYSKEGYAVLYEQSGKMNIAELLAMGVPVLERQSVFLMEFLANRVFAANTTARGGGGGNADDRNGGSGSFGGGAGSGSWGVVVVMDLGGADSSQLRSDLQVFRRAIRKIRTEHYPMKVKRVIIINGPFWVTPGIVKRSLPPGTQVAVYNSWTQVTYDQGLREYIPVDQIPTEYGGTSPYPVNEHPLELDLAALARRKINTNDNHYQQHQQQRRFDFEKDGREGSGSITVSSTEHSMRRCGSSSFGSLEGDNNNNPAAVPGAGAAEEEQQRRQQQYLHGRGGGGGERSTDEKKRRRKIRGLLFKQLRRRRNVHSSGMSCRPSWKNMRTTTTSSSNSIKWQ